jgi:hypothetical protein
VVYAVVKADIGTGLSISSYVLAAGQWLGLTEPDSFSFAYDVETNQVLSAPYAGKVFGPEWGVPPGKGQPGLL